MRNQFIGLLLAVGASGAQAAFVEVCDRTPAVAKVIVDTVNEQQAAAKTCAEISRYDLDSLTRVAVDGLGIGGRQILGGDRCHGSGVLEVGVQGWVAGCRR